jgi:hypothetical protein
MAAVLQVGQEQGKFHQLVYDASSTQPVKMLQEAIGPQPVPPAFHDTVGTRDFKAGQFTGDPQLPPPKCP